MDKADTEKKKLKIGILSLNKNLYSTRSLFNACKARGYEGGFRSNLHRCGAATIVKLTSAERSTAAVSAAETASYWV